MTTAISASRSQDDGSRPASRWRSEERAAGNLVVADHVAHCADEARYGIADAVVEHSRRCRRKGEKVAGRSIRDLVTVNGIASRSRTGAGPGPGVIRQAGTRGGGRSPVSEQRMRDMFEAMDRCCGPIRKSASRTRIDRRSGGAVAPSPQRRGMPCWSVSDAGITAFAFAGMQPLAG